MKNYLEIGIVIYLLITGIDMALGTDIKIWNQVYFIKENLLSLFLCLILFEKVNSSYKMMLLVVSMIFFGLRVIFNVFAYDYSNNWIFGLTFVGIVMILLSIFIYQLKWKT